MALRSRKTTRHVPLIFVDGDPEKVAKLKTLLPDATYTTWGRLKTALPRAIARPPASPIVPPDAMYTGKPAVEKLGVKTGMRASACSSAPQGVAETACSRCLPASRCRQSPTADGDLFLVFVRSQRELAAQLASLARTVERQTLWMVWPKKASGVRTDFNGNVVRETGLASGWVDFKVCSVNDTWSGLAFKRRANRTRQLKRPMPLRARSPPAQLLP